MHFCTTAFLQILIVRAEGQLDWQELQIEPTTASFDVLVHLRQPSNGLRHLEDLFWSVSDPTSSKYAQFLGNEQLAKLVGADEDTLLQVKGWLTDAGASKVEVLPHNDTVRAVLQTIPVVQRLLGPELRFVAFQHRTSLTHVVRALGNACITRLPDFVEFITGICGMPGSLGRSHTSPSGRRRPRGRKYVQDPQSGCAACPTITLVDNPPTITWMPARKLSGECLAPSEVESSCPTSFVISVSDFHSGEPVYSKTVRGDSAYCNPNECILRVTAQELGGSPEKPSGLLRWSVTALWRTGANLTTSTPVGFVAAPPVLPTMLRSLYNIPEGLEVTHPRATQAVYEENGNFSRNDLQEFLSRSTLHPRAHSGRVVLHGNNDETQPDVESTMDVQLISAMAPGSETTFWNVPPDRGDGSFLEWSAEVAMTLQPPLVHSVSFGPAEEFAATAGIPADMYVRRVNTELMKMGIRGLTVVFADGDAGASCNPIYGNCSFASPVWPASSQFGLAVGATFLATNSSGGREELPMASDLGASLTTGGGFSYSSPRPKHQDAAVTRYLKQASYAGTLPPNSFFKQKDWQEKRALPDMAALGIGLYMVHNGSDTLAASGASAATPIVAAIVTLLNDARLNAGQPPMGPLAPFLYAAHAFGAFHDITVGGNRCFETPTWTHESTINDTCCAFGFQAALGYDPVSGLGTPDFQKLRTLALDAAVGRTSVFTV